MKTFKKFFATLQIIAIVSLFCSFPAYADTRPAFGEEQPFIFCTFENEQGETVDGNALTSGDYTVNVILSEMEQNSIFQFTAAYNFDTEAITSLDVVSTNENMSYGGIKKTNDALVVVLASEDENGNALDGETAYVQMAVTIDVEENSTIDFRDCFRFDKNPDLTFVESDYEDGIENAYVLDTSTNTQYQTSKMIADESPSLNGNYFTVDGQITVALNTTGTSDTGTGKAGISVTVVSTTSDFTSTVTTADNGEYSLRDIPEGEYTMTVSGQTTIDRSVNLTVNDSKSDAGIIELPDIPVIICDYNKSGDITSVDKMELNRGLKGNVSHDFCDINCDGSVSSVDTMVFNKFYNRTVTYEDLTL